MAVTNAERIAVLEAAMAAGTRRVSYDGKTVEYGSIEEMERAIAYFRAKERASGGKGAVGVSVGSYYRG